MNARLRRAAWPLSWSLALALGANCRSSATSSSNADGDSARAATPATLVTPDAHTAHVGDGAPGPNASAPQAPFEPPTPDGWGRVEGLAYWEVLLGGARADEALPLLLLIHGMGDVPGPHWLQTVRVGAKLRVVMPRAPKPYGGGFSWFDYRVRDNEPVALGRGIAAEAERLARALAVLRARRPTLGQPIVAGFSQGGMLALELAVHHPRSMSLALPISGMLPATLWPSTRDASAPNPRIRALHGDRDQVVEYEPTARLLQLLQGLGFDATLQTFQGVGHSIPPDVQRSIETLLTEAARNTTASSQ